MRILVISRSPWDDRNSIGNTFSNWFTDWSDAEFFGIYCRASLPDNKVCHKYYMVPPLALLKNMFRPSKTGWSIDTKSENSTIEAGNEQTLIQNAQQGKKEWMYLVTDLAYSTGVWKSAAYKRFIAEANPDIVFSFAEADAFLYENYCYLKQHTHAKIVTFIADDTYGSYLENKTIRNRLQARRFHKMMHMSDLVYGASEMMCQAYQRDFGRKVIPLYKGCTLGAVKKSNNNPLRIVYAGNLLWGRSDILGALAEALEKVNKENTKATLEIYTGSFVTPEMESKLNRGESSRIMGRRAYEEIVQIMHDADIVLHVESFDPRTIKIVRYSFSTKIIDCMQSGTAMMVIGPAGIASVEYPRQIPGVIVVDKIEDIQQRVKDIVSNPSVLVESAQSINDFAQKNHSIDSVRKSLHDDFIELLLKK